MIYAESQRVRLSQTDKSFLDPTLISLSDVKTFIRLYIRLEISALSRNLLPYRLREDNQIVYCGVCTNRFTDGLRIANSP